MSLYHPGVTGAISAAPATGSSDVQIPATQSAITRFSERTGFTESEIREIAATHQQSLIDDSGRTTVAAGFASDAGIDIAAVGDDMVFFEVPDKFWLREREWINAPPSAIRELPTLYGSTLNEVFDVSPSAEKCVYGISLPAPAASIYDAGARPVFSIIEFAEMLIEGVSREERESVLFSVDQKIDRDAAISVGESVYGVPSDVVDSDIGSLNNFIADAKDSLTDTRELAPESVFEVLSKFQKKA